MKRYTTYGVRRAVGELIRELRILQRHRQGLRKARNLTLGPDAKLQLGSGSQPKAGWVNVDLFAPADLSLDLREDLPFPESSVAFIYSEHVFEHLSYPRDAKHLLRECFRVLRPGGVLSLVVPHGGDALRAYVSGTESFFVETDRLRSYLTEETPTLMHHVNYWFRADGQHLYAYDEETLAQVLHDAGFTSARQRTYDASIDSEKRRQLRSLYMEATKPALPIASRTEDRSTARCVTHQHTGAA
jgi:predicted SAM-dependent methyltransferase